MGLDILIVVIVTSIIQSLFGVGVLLFGTPLLLLLGYPFMDSLLILLPISASINFLQVYKDYRYINRVIYKKILLFTIPLVILFLLLVSKNSININFIIGIFLIFIALKDNIKIFKTIFEKLLSYDKSFYLLMGAIHGMTNLGGALLTAKIFHTNMTKYEKRTTIAVSYMTFAIFQIITILFLDINYDLSNLLYIIVGIVTYIIINKMIFHRISDYKYDKVFSIFLIMSGIALIGKGIIW